MVLISIPVVSLTTLTLVMFHLQQSRGDTTLSEQNCLEYCNLWKNTPRIDELTKEFRFTCECRGNGDGTTTSVIQYGCDICDSNGNICLNVINEDTFPSNPPFEDARTMEKHCVTYTRGPNNGDSMCLTITNDPDTYYEDVLDERLVYNDKECTIIQEFYDDGAWFDCDGVVQISSADEYPVDGDPFEDATDIVDRFWGRWAGMSTGTMQDADIAPGQCRATSLPDTSTGTIDTTGPTTDTPDGDGDDIETVDGEQVSADDDDKDEQTDETDNDSSDDNMIKDNGEKKGSDATRWNAASRNVAAITSVFAFAMVLMM